MKILKLVVLFISFNLCGQSIQIKNIKDFELSNAGTLTANDNVGYYTFYTSKKEVGKKKKEGILSFFNKDLKEVTKVNFLLDNKTNRLIEVKNNGTNVAVSLYNKETKNLTYTFYDFEGKKLAFEYIIPYKKQTFAMGYYKEIQKMEEWILNYPVTNKGFLFSETIKKKRWGYRFSFVDGTEKKWTYDSPADINNRVQAAPIYSDENKIIIVEKIWGSNFDRQPDLRTVVLDINTGKEDFSVAIDYEKAPKFYTEGMVANDGRVVLFGEYYKKGHKFHSNSYNEGYFIEIYSKEGEKLSSQLLSYRNNPEFRKYLEIEDQAKQKKFGSIYFYDIVEKEDKFLIIGERFVRDVQGFSTGKAIVSASFGMLGQENWSSKYTLGDLVVLEVDKDAVLTNFYKITKDKAPSGLNSMNKWPLMNLRHMQNEYNVDYMYQEEQNGVLKVVSKNRKVEKVGKEEKLNYAVYKYHFDGNTVKKENTIPFQVAKEEQYRLIRGKENVLLLKYTDENGITLSIIK
ncbi:protein of unknown function [Tenacibaculum sp. 190130A14a]|uniref:WG repeat protein n=1 Tax=Tenacibaculum polynesiense TaxID=3137857 RepID=A0ABM9PCA5_9FLAO